MTVDVATPDDSRMTRARRAFRRWRKSRPFWGGLLLIAAGVEIFYSGNLNLGNIQIHLGLNGFKSYIIPLVVVLCGALIWATPAQRMFYGIIGTASAVYSVVSVNLGGFIIGLVLGIFGGALSIAWVPDKRVVADGVDHADPDDEDVTAEIGAPVAAYVGEDEEQWRDPDGEASEEQEGEQREPFRQPRHAADDEPEPVVPAARTAPETGPTIIGPEDGADEVAYPGDPNETTAPMSRVRSIPDVPHSRGPAEDAGDDPSAGEQPNERGDGRANPRALTITVIALTLGALAAFAIHNAAPASADTCTPTPMQSAIQSAIAKSGLHEPAGTKTKAPATTTAAATPKHHGDAALAPIAGDQPQPVASIVSGVLGVLGLGSPTGGTAPTAAAASASPDPAPADTPSASPSSPAQTPTTTPSPTATPTPTTNPRPTVTKSSPRPSTSRSTAPRPSTSSSAPLCSTTPKALARADGQPIIGERPATLKTRLLTSAGLSYDGNVSLPTARGSIVAMQFSMTSTTSTPFELDVPVGDHQCTVTSSQLTLTDNVKIFATELKGNLAGVVPVDFTPDSPPPLPPLAVSDPFFTDATLTLAFVQSDTLTADKFTITSD